jgi:hypothetical protein
VLQSKRYSKADPQLREALEARLAQEVRDRPSGPHGLRAGTLSEKATTFANVPSRPTWPRIRCSFGHAPRKTLRWRIGGGAPE